MTAKRWTANTTTSVNVMQEKSAWKEAMPVTVKKRSAQHLNADVENENVAVRDWRKREKHLIEIK